VQPVRVHETRPQLRNVNACTCAGLLEQLHDAAPVIADDVHLDSQRLGRRIKQTEEMK
jgi:hypothetical protein